MEKYSAYVKALMDIFKLQFHYHVEKIQQQIRQMKFSPEKPIEG